MTSPRCAFITGINGFVGGYLAGHLASQGWAVAGMDRQPQSVGVACEYFKADILNTAELVSILGKCRPERIFHLAAVSMPSAVDQSPRQALEVNIMGTVSLLDAVRASGASGPILLVGSSKQYGAAGGGAPIAEEIPCLPADLYGISKQAGEMIGFRYAGQFGMDIRFVRSFNHTGPGQPPAFVCSDWARQVAAIELGMAEPVIRVGDLTQAVDFCHVADVVRAYTLILDKGKSGTVYNVCSGRAIFLRDMLSLFMAKSSRPISVAEDPSRMRGQNRDATVVGDPARISRDTGWKPVVPIEKTVEELFRYWLGVLPSARG
jgi:GDP-4-dehydro-6-deoxy-D-mannose reductase